MDLFRLLTPVSYWLLIGMWTLILAFYIRRLVSPRLASKLFMTLIIILSIDAFRTLFESAYFGAWYTSKVGLLPEEVFHFLERPFYVFIPKIINVIAAALVIAILVRRWVPQEEEEWNRQLRYTRDLEEQVAERTRAERALATHAGLLEEANTALEARNRELDEFTQIASHDLQEPLRKLTAFSEALNDDMRNGEVDEVATDLKAISSGARRMQALVKDLLVLCRSGRQDMQRECMRLDECVDRALEALEIRLEETHADIVRQDLPNVRGDVGLLTQLYQNLIGNALKFSGDEVPRITLTVEQRGDGWVLGVRDNGIGIDPAKADEIFSPFKRLHPRGKYEGTGIGLAICRKIVERHGGEIWVESTPGKGAHFRFTLGRGELAASERTT